MSALVNRQWTLARHPINHLKPEHFAYREQPVGSPGEGEVLLEVLYLNIAPVMRMYMMSGGAAGEAPLEPGDVIHGRGVARVLASRSPDYQEGDYVQGQMGWQTHKLSRMSPAEKMRKLCSWGLPVHYALSALGMTGFSAYCGFFSRGRPQPGEAVLVSGAAGGVGSLVIQMARLHGCHPVIGIAGSQSKCELVCKLGCDAAIDYRRDKIDDALVKWFPAGIDLYFDNVGGEVLVAALNRLALGARVVLCGSISEYQREEPFGLPNYTVLRDRNATMLGFFVYHHLEEFDQAEERIADWLRAGQLKVTMDMVEGFEAMPGALMEMFSGTQGGKRLVKLCSGPDPVC